jgi:hypothetical protein
VRKKFTVWPAWPVNWNQSWSFVELSEPMIRSPGVNVVAAAGELFASLSLTTACVASKSSKKSTASGQVT